MEDFERYKNYPEGSGGRKEYDRNVLETEEYLNKYYSSDKLIRWKKFYKEFISTLLLSNEEFYERHLYDVKAPFFVDFSRFKYFVAVQRIEKFSDEELYYFFAFLYSISFFKTMSDLLEWTTKHQFLGLSFDEIMKIKNGKNFVKCMLRELPILNHG